MEARVLDDLRKIQERDTQSLLEAAGRQGEQLTHECELKGSDITNVRHIVYSAMGGSALPAPFLKSLLPTTIPIEVVQGYEIPSYVDGSTLFIAASFSGDTEETLAALEQARQLGAQIAIMTGGGRLRQLADEHGYLLAVLPQVFPRLSLWHGFHALLQILEKAHVLQDDSRPLLEQGAHFADMAAALWRPEVATSNNPAKRIAQELMGKSVVVCSGPKMYPAVCRWKIGLNENAKQVAWASQYPELNHNELIGWSKQPVEKPYAVVELRSTFEHPRVQRRFEVTGRLLSGMRPAPLVINAEGSTILEQLVWSALLGDFVSLYLAILNGLDPAPLDLVEKFKQALGV